MKNKQYYVYILTNKMNTTLYTGVTGDLIKRVFQHKCGQVYGFSSKYKTSKLVYYEFTSNVYSAITREKQLKSGSRQQKLDLVNGFNPAWDDLYEGLKSA